MIEKLGAPGVARLLGVAALGVQAQAEGTEAQETEAEAYPMPDEGRTEGEIDEARRDEGP